jgi:hypothetical protein
MRASYGSVDFAERVSALKRLQTGTIAEFGTLLPAILDRAFKDELVIPSKTR